MQVIFNKGVKKGTVKQIDSSLAKKLIKIGFASEVSDDKEKKVITKKKK